MKKLGALAVLILMSISGRAFAGQETHGGHSVVCKTASGAIKSIQLLDHFEGAVVVGAPLEMGDSSKGYLEMVRYVLKRLAKLEAYASRRFLERAEQFESEMALLDPSQMRIIGDANEVFHPGANCYKVQFAFQVIPAKQYQKRYYVNRELWEAADEQTKAGLVLHEVIYRDAVEVFGATNSDGTRYLNYVISSSKMNGMDGQGLVDLAHESGFLTTRSSGAVTSCLFSRIIDGVPVCMVDGTSAKRGGFPLPTGFDGEYQTPFGSLPLSERGYVYFDDGKLRAARLRAVATLKVRGGEIQIAPEDDEFLKIEESNGVTKISGKWSGTIGTSVGDIKMDSAYGSRELRLYNNGQVSLADIGWSKVSLNGQTIAISDYVSFYESGALAATRVMSSVTLLREDGSSVKLTTSPRIYERLACVSSVDYSVTFNEQGRVTGAYRNPRRSGCR